MGGVWWNRFESRQFCSGECFAPIYAQVSRRPVHSVTRTPSQSIGKCSAKGVGVSPGVKTRARARKCSASVCDARFVVDLHNADLLHIYYIVFFFFFLGTIFYT